MYVIISIISYSSFILDSLMRELILSSNKMSAFSCRILNAYSVYVGILMLLPSEDHRKCNTVSLQQFNTGLAYT